MIFTYKKQSSVDGLVIVRHEDNIIEIAVSVVVNNYGPLVKVEPPIVTHKTDAVMALVKKVETFVKCTHPKLASYNFIEFYYSKPIFHTNFVLTPIEKS